MTADAPAVASLLALLLLIVVSCVSRINVGVLGIALAWIIAVLVAGWRPAQVIAGFPSGLFLTLAGVTLLFGGAQANGTIARLAGRAVGLARGKRQAVTAMLFAIAFLVSTTGPGAILAVAVTVPLAMAVGRQVGVSPFVVALVVANGANAGNLSPVSSVGVIANDAMAKAGLPGHEGKVWLAGFLAHLAVTVVAVGLLAWLGRRREAPAPVPDSSGEGPGGALERRHWLTALVIAVWIGGVVGLGLPVGLASFAAVGLLLLARLVDERDAFRQVPLGIIVMVTGMSTLVAMLEKTGGIELFSSLLAKLASAGTVNGVMGFVTGLISTYSSTSAVVLPAFLPTAPGVAAQVGGDPVAVSLSITVGSALVDVSPLSTLGALCVAAVTDPATATLLFRQLLLWGLGMVVVGALLTGVFAGALAGL